MFRSLALSYASNHATMTTGVNCGDNFPNGISNGADWFAFLIDLE